MEDHIFKYVLDYGSLGIMSGLLFWLYLQNSKQLEKIREQSREDEERIRERFAGVIEKYDEERQKFFNERSELRGQLLMNVETLEKGLNKQEQLLDSLKDKIDQILIKNS